MDIFNFFSSGILVAAIFQMLFAGLLLYWGAGIAGIEERKFGKSIILAVTISILTASLLVIFSIPILSSVSGFILGLSLSCYIVKTVFNTTFGKSAIAIIMAWILSLIVTAIGFFVATWLISLAN